MTTQPRSGKAARKKRVETWWTIKAPDSGNFWLPNYLFKTKKEALLSICELFKELGYRPVKIRFEEI